MGWRSLVLIALLLVCLPAPAQVRKWVDEDGQVHYEDSDSPKTPGASAQSAGEGSGSQELTPEQERLEKQKRVLEAMETERRAKQEQQKKGDQERKESAAKCESAKQELTRRQEARYLYRKGGGDGERVVLSEEERAKATAEAEVAVNKWCK
jgi:hypothetical protein